MKLREQFDVAQPVASVWSFFDKPERVAQCVPGVEELTVVTEDDIDVRVTQNVGPMSATFAAKVLITERVAEKLIAFTATGKSVRGAMGNVRATVAVQLEPVGERTIVLVEAEVALAGALGSVGQKVVAKQAGRVTRQFACNLEEALGGPRTSVAASAAVATQPDARELSLSSPASSGRRGADPWPKLAAALSGVSVVLAIIVLRQNRRTR